MIEPRRSDRQPGDLQGHRPSAGGFRIVRRVFRYKRLVSTYMRINAQKGPDYPEWLKNAYQLSGKLDGCGGQHRQTVGDSTFDDETKTEAIERLRRVYDELHEPFDEQAVSDCYAYRGMGNLDRDEARAFVAFERERQALANEGNGVAF